jgi:hypothetical protein
VPSETTADQLLTESMTTVADVQGHVLEVVVLNEDTDLGCPIIIDPGDATQAREPLWLPPTVKVRPPTVTSLLPVCA